MISNISSIHCSIAISALVVCVLDCYVVCFEVSIELIVVTAAAVTIIEFKKSRSLDAYDMLSNSNRSLFPLNCRLVFLTHY